jgi:hypothetical protein
MERGLRDRADVGRQEPVEGDRRGVGGEHEAEAELGPGEGRAEDLEPDQRRQGGLDCLEDDPGRYRPGRQLAELVEELVEPVVDRDAESVEDDDEDGDAADPGGDPEQASRRRLPFARLRVDGRGPRRG